MSLHDVMDDAADLAMAQRRLDPAEILARSGYSGYRRSIAEPIPKVPRRWGGTAKLGLVAAVVLGLLLILLPAVHRAAPIPAKQPPGPGAVPRSLYLPPVWTPDITEQPISRAVYVASAATSDKASAAPAGPWLVGADHGEYRTLPVTDQSSEVVLSADGKYVAWAQHGPYGSRTQVRLVEVATGALRSIDLPGSRRRGLAVQHLAFDRSDTWLAIQGRDELGAAAAEDRPSLAVIDVRSGAVRSVCRTASKYEQSGVAWAQDGRLIAACLPVGADSWLPVGQLPSAAKGRSLTSSLLPDGMPEARPLVSGHGESRWTVTARDELLGQSQQAVLRGPGLAGVDLGAVVGAEGLAVTARGVIITRWSAAASSGGSQFGPSDVVQVATAGPAPGTVSVLSRVVGDRVRAIAVAADVITGGRTTAGVRPGHRVLDLNWWSWIGVTGLAHLPWWLRGIAIGALALFLGARRAGRRAPRPGRGRRGRSRLVRVTVGTAGVLLAGASAGILLLPTEAAPASRPAGVTDAAVLPRVLADQKLRPPRAFDRSGHPRTTAVSLVFSAEIADREGLYGTDAATGALVRLDDLPGTLDEDTAIRWPGNVAVSPNGRFLANGILVVDLKTARVTPIPGVEGSSVAWMGEPIAESVAVLDDGSVVFTSSGGGQLWRSGPPGSGASAKRVTGVDDVVYVRPPTAGQVLVAHYDSKPTVEMVDLSGARPDVVGLAGVDQQEQVAVAGDRVLRVRADGKLELRALSKPGKADPTTAFDLPGGVDRLALTPPVGNRTTLVALGAGTRVPLAVLRTGLDVAVGSAGPVTELTRLDPDVLAPGAPDTGYAVNRLLLAPEVIATAAVTDVPAEPGWAPLTGSRWRAVAGGIDAIAGLILALLVFERVSRRRAAAPGRATA